MRTFIAVELPAPVRSQVQMLQEHLQSELHRHNLTDCFRWTPVENLHITLRFLGETTPAQRAALAQGLSESIGGVSPFSLHLGGLGAYPTLSRPTVLWLGIHGDRASLAVVQTACEQLARSAGFPPEEQSFSPHLTLARARRHIDRQRLASAGDILKALSRSSSAPVLDNLPMRSVFWVNEVVHMQSELLPSGPVYTPLHRIHF